MKTPKLLLTLLLVLTLKALSAQQKLHPLVKEHHILSNKLSWQTAQMQDVLAIKTFETIQKKFKPSSIDVNNAIKVFSRIKDFKSSNKWIEYAMVNFGTSVGIYYRNDYNITEKDIKKMRCYNRQDSLYDIYITYEKHLVSTDLVHLFLNDMLFRNFLDTFRFDDCIKDKYKLAISIAFQYDSGYTLPTILDIIKKYNFPNEYEIGMHNTQYLLFMLRHVFDRPEHKTILDSALYNGKIEPREYASIVDYVFNRDNKGIPLKNYGSMKERKGKENFLAYIHDIENVDKRREEIGLLPLWKDCKIYNYQLSKEYLEYMKNNSIEN